MSVSRTGALQESYKYYTISIDGFDGRLLRGQVYHSSLDHGLQFRSLSEMAFILEGMFERLHYPMKSGTRGTSIKSTCLGKAGTFLTVRTWKKKRQREVWGNSGFM